LNKEDRVNIYLDCIPCFLRQSLDASRNITEDDHVHEQIVQEVLRLILELDRHRPPPWVGQIIHRRLRELTGVEDPYREPKSRFNQLTMSLLPELRAFVKRDRQPLIAAAKAAIAANIIDFGIKSSLDEGQVIKALQASFTTDVYGDMAEFQQQVEKANEILYLADNAGEIVIDRLLIEELGPERVTLAVRGRAVINDATIDDARAAGLHEMVRVIDNGSDAPGTILDDCSAEFVKRFHGADLIIAKGQGNFETLSQTVTNTFFLLKLKCPVIAKHVGLPSGTHAVLQPLNRELASTKDAGTCEVL
jgi:damage-control phosphatase, subfamily I